MTTISVLADQAYAAMTTGKRDNGESYVHFGDNAPSWATDLAHAAHGDMMPDDWRYAVLHHALEALSYPDHDTEDGMFEFADSMVDSYNAARSAWLASHLERAGYVDQAIETHGWDAEGGIWAAIGAGQYEEAREIYDATLAFLRELSEEMDEAA